MPVRDRDSTAAPSLHSYYRIDPAPLRVNSGNFQQNNNFQSIFNMTTKNCDNAAPNWPSYSNVGSNAFKVNSGNSQNNRVFPFNFNIPMEKKVDNTDLPSMRNHGDNSAVVALESGGLQGSSDFQFTFKMPMQNRCIATPNLPAYSPVDSAPSTIHSEYPQDQMPNSLKASSGITKPSVYIFKGSNTSNEKGISRIPRLAPFNFNAAAFINEKENTRSSQLSNFNLRSSALSGVNGTVRRPSITTFGSSASSNEKSKSKIPISTTSKAFVSTGDKENMNGSLPVSSVFGLSYSFKEKSNMERPVPFSFGSSNSCGKSETASTPQVVPFTFTVSAPTGAKANSKPPVHGNAQAFTFNAGNEKASAPTSVPFIFGTSTSPEERSNSKRPAPFTFKGSSSSKSTEHANESKIVPFTFSLSTPPVANERTSALLPFRFDARAPTSSNLKRNLKLTLPAPLIFKPSTSPELKENARPPKSLALIFDEPSSVSQISFQSRSASSAHATNVSSKRSSLDSKEKQETLTQGICMSALRSPSNMCALRRGRRSQYSAVRSSPTIDDAATQEMAHTKERQCNSSEEPKLLFSAFATATSGTPHSPLRSKRKHETIYKLQDVPTTDNSLLLEEEHVPKRRCDSLDVQQPLGSSPEIQTALSSHTPLSLKRNHDMLFITQGLPAHNTSSYCNDLNGSVASQQFPIHPIIGIAETTQQEESPTVKRRRDSSDERSEVEVSMLKTVRKEL